MDDGDEYEMAEAREMAADEAADREAALRQEVEEADALAERLGVLLRGTADALKGPPPELTFWSYHDLPVIAAALVAENKRYREALVHIAKLDTMHSSAYACVADMKETALNGLGEL